MPATGPWGFLTFIVLIVIVAFATGHLPSATGTSFFSSSSVVTLVCTGGEMTTHGGHTREATDRNPGVAMTLHLDTHLVQVHVSDNQPIQAPIKETEDDIYFHSETLHGDINRLTGKARVEVIDPDTDRRWNFDALECNTRSHRF